MVKSRRGRSERKVRTEEQRSRKGGKTRRGDSRKSKEGLRSDLVVASSMASRSSMSSRKRGLPVHDGGAPEERGLITDASSTVALIARLVGVLRNALGSYARSPDEAVFRVRCVDSRHGRAFFVGGERDGCGLGRCEGWRKTSRLLFSGIFATRQAVAGSGAARASRNGTGPAFLTWLPFFFAAMLSSGARTDDAHRQPATYNAYLRVLRSYNQAPRDAQFLGQDSLVLCHAPSFSKVPSSSHDTASCASQKGGWDGPPHSTATGSIFDFSYHPHTPNLD
jgi:hypothetical protein